MHTCCCCVFYYYFFLPSPWACVKGGCSEWLLSNIKSRSLQQTRQIQSKHARVSRRTPVIRHFCVTSTTLMNREKWIPVTAPFNPRAKRAGDLCFNDALHSCLEPVKMFGFHKSKIYRSNEGCCICKTKSSSSRFTDSSRYEENFRLCFGWVFSRHRSYPKHSQRNTGGISVTTWSQS